MQIWTLAQLTLIAFGQVESDKSVILEKTKRHLSQYCGAIKTITVTYSYSEIPAPNLAPIDPSSPPSIKNEVLRGSQVPVSHKVELLWRYPKVRFRLADLLRAETLANAPHTYWENGLVMTEYPKAQNVSITTNQPIHACFHALNVLGIYVGSSGFTHSLAWHFDQSLQNGTATVIEPYTIHGVKCVGIRMHIGEGKWPMDFWVNLSAPYSPPIRYRYQLQANVAEFINVSDRQTLIKDRETQTEFSIPTKWLGTSALRNSRLLIEGIELNPRLDDRDFKFTPNPSFQVRKNGTIVANKRYAKPSERKAKASAAKEETRNSKTTDADAIVIAARNSVQNQFTLLEMGILGCAVLALTALSVKLKVYFERTKK